jgi:predicted metal-dependent phosphoesterase TrpH
MLIDLHVHSHHTKDCALKPIDAARRAKDLGLDGLVFTDLNTIEGLEEFRAAGRDAGILALAGVELATDHGHYLCYLPDPAKLASPPQVFGTTPWPVRDVIERVHALGGVVVAAHPYDKTIDRPAGDFIFTLTGLAAVEGFSGRRNATINELAVEAADHMSLPCIGGSGAHAAEDLGNAATLLRNPVKNEAELVAQLKAGAVHCVAIGVTPRPEGEDRGDRRDRGGDRGRDRDRGRGGGGRDRGRGHGGGRDRDRR